MTLGDYNIHQGWKLPADQNPNDEGYLVEYIDGGKANHPDHKGYISWSPKDVFEAAYKPNGKLSFGSAIEAAKQGKPISRTGWNGVGMFAYIVPESKFPAQTGVAKLHFGKNAMVPYRAYWALKTAQGDVAAWSPSGSDSLAEDWFILDEVGSVPQSHAPEQKTEETFSSRDLVSFGNYLLSKGREESLKKTSTEVPGSLPYEERFRDIHDADLENWKFRNKN